jgi:hypothetical protein
MIRSIVAKIVCLRRELYIIYGTKKKKNQENLLTITA